MKDVSYECVKHSIANVYICSQNFGSKHSINHLEDKDKSTALVFCFDKEYDYVVP